MSGALRLAAAGVAVVAATTGAPAYVPPPGPDQPAGTAEATAALRPTTGFRAPPADLVAAAEDPDPTAFHEFKFTRAAFTDFRPLRSSFLGDAGPAWSTDYPNGDRHFTIVARRLTVLDAAEEQHYVSLADPKIRNYPFLYAVEVGWMRLTEAEVKGLRNYLAAGGFVVIDDFWGTTEWRQFERQMERVLPGRKIVDIPRDHLIYRIFYDIEGDLLQVPNVGNGEEIAKGVPHARTWERDGYEPHLRGIFDADGRLLMAINWNTDLGDAWEHADHPYYPLRFSTFACELGLNMLLYGMSE